ncbi:hypothetical protein G6F64_014511 [Rhizopus arrhizus]|uniref:Uncharacterized protein n=1 Tax=Rhizopus oryzae TaxID=64495 RepID=A0A9P6WTA5_RHIOR|nr:hypothetical protein G6F64_014511 [Rhizopus arrhizus]
MRPARRENGSDCSQTLPGPVSVARNTPSPPNSMLLTPVTRLTSMSTVGCVDEHPAVALQLLHDEALAAEQPGHDPALELHAELPACAGLDS